LRGCLPILLSLPVTARWLWRPSACPSGWAKRPLRSRQAGHFDLPMSPPRAHSARQEDQKCGGRPTCQRYTGRGRGHRDPGRANGRSRPDPRVGRGCRCCGPRASISDPAPHLRALAYQFGQAPAPGTDAVVWLATEYAHADLTCHGVATARYTATETLEAADLQLNAGGIARIAACGHPHAADVTAALAGLAGSGDLGPAAQDLPDPVVLASGVDRRERHAGTAPHSDPRHCSGGTAITCTSST
jgi:hypothetical protein